MDIIQALLKLSKSDVYIMYPFILIGNIGNMGSADIIHTQKKTNTHLTFTATIDVNLLIIPFVTVKSCDYVWNKTH